MEKSLNTRRAISFPYRPDIDGLRAIAVAGVILFHASPTLFHGGFIGVDVFFGISGFLITGILRRDLEERRFSLSRFYGHRVRRIFPSLIIVLFAVWALGSVILLQNEFLRLGADLAYSATFLSNFKLWLEAGYFDVSAEVKPLLHIWSLAVEEQFYLIWPAVLFFAWKWARVRPRAILWTLVSIASASFFVNLISVEIAPGATFFLPGTRLWEFLGGALLAFYPLPKKYDSKKEPLALVGFGLLALGFVKINPLTSFPGTWALAPVLGTVALLASGPKTWIGRVLSLPLLTGIGRISYPLYLWHWPLLCLARIAVGQEPSPIVRASIVMLATLLAWTTYRCAELPIRARLADAHLRRRGILVLVGSLGFCALLGLVTVFFGGFPGRTSGIPATPNSIALHRKTMTDEHCPLSPGQRENIIWCRGASDSPPAYALIGDSHAQALFPSLVRATEKNSEAWIVIANPGCGPAGCKAAVSRAIESVSEIPTVMWVVLVFSAQDLNLHGNLDPRIAEALPILSNGIDRLRNAGKRIAMLIDNPTVTLYPERCDHSRPIERFGIHPRRDCAISRVRHEENLAGFRSVVAHLKEKFPDLLIFDPTDILCGPEECPVVLNDRSLYDYTDHLSEYGGDLVAPALLEKIRSEKK